MSFIIGHAISLWKIQVGMLRPTWMSMLLLRKNESKSRIREGFLFLKGVYIRVYLLGRHEITDKELPSSDEIASIIWNFIEAGIARGTRS